MVSVNSTSSEQPAQSAAPKPLVGRVEPRLFTPPLRDLNRHTSRGYEVIDFANMVGEPLLPWQEWAAIHALEIKPDGNFRFRVVLILVARQNGKSHLKRIVSLWRLYVDGAHLVLGCGQDVTLAREQWQMSLEIIKDNPELEAELETIRKTNGDEWFRLQGGGRYKIIASNRRAGRGLSADELTFDELRTQTSWDAWSALSKTTMARANGQIWAMSNAGDDDSVVLNQLRDRALSEKDPSLGIFEWSAPDGCELGDEEGWCAANPGLGHTVSEAAIRSALGTDPPQVFRTEVLCQKVDQLAGAINLGAWKACIDASTTLGSMDRKRIAVCFDVAVDDKGTTHATLAGAATTADGKVRVQIIEAWRTVEDARAALGDLLDRVKPVSIAWYPTGPGGGFAPILRARDGNVELIGSKVAEACMGLADLVKSRQVVHGDEPLLNVHVGGAQKMSAADGWRFTRRGGGHVDAAYAAAGAAYLALTMPPPVVPRIRVMSWLWKHHQCYACGAWHERQEDHHQEDTSRNQDRFPMGFRSIN